MANRNPKVFALVVGIIAIVIGSGMLLVSLGRLKTHEKTYATVVDARSHTTHARHSRTHYYATVQYTYNGQEYSCMLECDNRKNIGDGMVIYCKKDDPRVVYGNYQMWKTPILLILCGAFCVVMVIFFGDRIGR